MATYTFKSVGVTQTQSTQQTTEKSPQPVGIPTPLSPAADGSLLQLSYSVADQVHYNLRDLLMTNWGERLGLYNFGANLQPLCAEYQNQEDFDNAVMENIRTAIARWMPYVELENYTSQVETPLNERYATIPHLVRITITYSVSQLGVAKRALQITLKLL